MPSRRALGSPKSALYTNDHSTATTTIGRVTGMKKAIRNQVLPLGRSVTSPASTRPTATSSPMVAIT